MINFDSDGPDRIIGRIERLFANAGNMATPLLAAGAAVRDLAVQRFQSQGGDQQWPPNKRGGQTGVDTGRLRASLAVTQSDPLTVRVGTNVYYARWFQEGTGIYAGHSAWTVTPQSKRALAFSSGGQEYVRASATIPGQPPRPFLVLGDAERARIARIFAKWFSPDELA